MIIPHDPEYVSPSPTRGPSTYPPMTCRPQYNESSTKMIETPGHVTWFLDLGTSLDTSQKRFAIIVVFLLTPGLVPYFNQQTKPLTARVGAFCKGRVREWVPFEVLLFLRENTRCLTLCRGFLERHHFDDLLLYATHAGTKDLFERPYSTPLPPVVIITLTPPPEILCIIEEHPLHNVSWAA